VIRRMAELAISMIMVQVMGTVKCLMRGLRDC
jgi:hypothetical protein